MIRLQIYFLLVFLSIGAFGQQINFVKDDVMNSYMESGYATEKFAPKGKVDDNRLRQGKWKDYEVIDDFSYCSIDGMPKQIFGKFLLYGEGEFLNGKRVGFWRIYTIEDKTYRKILHKEVTYVNGIENGSFKYFFPSKKLGISGNYKNGELDGKILSYHENGSIYGLRYYIDGEKDGTHIYKFPNGNTELEHSFSKGIKNGLYQTFYDSGKLKEKFTYSMGKIDGIYQYYYPNGQLWIEKIYKEDLLMEVTNSYSPDGDLRDKGTISNGNGTVNYYTEAGEIYTVQTFKDGIKIKEEEK